MKTMREYIDIINELNRRDFLKGVGGAATLAAAGGAKARIPIGVPIPSYEDTDPPLLRKPKLVWNYFKKDALDEQDFEHIARLVHLMYIARMTNDDYRDSQGGRIIGGALPSEIYKSAYELVVFINDSFLDLRIDSLMNKVKSRFEQIQKNDPTRWATTKENYFQDWEKIIVRGKILKQQLTK